MREAKKKTRRQMVEQARAAALAGNWQDAVEINQQLLDRSPRDAEAHNRLGRAYLELEQPVQALEAYTAALKSDPANIIARRNLQRLDLLRHQPTDEGANSEEKSTSVIPRTLVFIEEVGKTWVDELVNPIAMENLADVSSGEQLQLVVEGNRLMAARANGQQVGQVEAKTAERILDLMSKGNRYEVYALGISRSSLRVIFREVYRDPEVGRLVSFPRQISATRAYLRERDLLRQRDESDFLFLDDDDDVEDEEPGAEPADDEDSGDSESETFIEDTVVVEEEDSQI